MSSENDDNTLAEAMGEIDLAYDADADNKLSELEEAAADTVASKRETNDDVSVVASEIDWLSVWDTVPVGPDERLSWTQASLAVAVSDETGVAHEDGAGSVLIDAREQDILVGRELEGSIVELQIAPHVVEESDAS
jgi:hypothetical protein